MLSALVAGSALIAGPSFAAKEVIHDASSDVMYANVDTEGVLVMSPHPTDRTTDITRTVVNHTARRLVVRLKFRNARIYFAPELYLEVKTATKPYVIYYERGLRGSDWVVIDARKNRIASCPGFRHSFDFADNLAVASVPRGCIGAPRWVRMRVGAIGTGDGRDIFDDAQREGLRHDLRLVQGPRIRKG